MIKQPCRTFAGTFPLNVNFLVYLRISLTKWDIRGIMCVVDIHIIIIRLLSSLVKYFGTLYSQTFYEQKQE